MAWIAFVIRFTNTCSIFIRSSRSTGRFGWKSVTSLYCLPAHLAPHQQQRVLQDFRQARFGHLQLPRRGKVQQPADHIVRPLHGSAHLLEDFLRVVAIGCPSM
jgi:hypothetical protein